MESTCRKISRKEAKEQKTLSVPADTFGFINIIRHKNDHPVRHSCAGRNLLTDKTLPKMQNASQKFGNRKHRIIRMGFLPAQFVCLKSLTS
jgi:hypothetical protein